MNKFFYLLLVLQIISAIITYQNFRDREYNHAREFESFQYKMDVRNDAIRERLNKCTEKIGWLETGLREVKITQAYENLKSK